MLARAHQLEEQLIAWRREFHAHPELGFQEQRTAARVAEVLRGLGLQVRTGVGKTGVVGELGQGSPTVAIRADMDALPIQEANDVPYASQVPGVMHACGHDAHTAIGLGVATLLAQEKLPGQVRFLFQPCEETTDEEGKSGAVRMVEEGALEGVEAVLALHVDSNIPTGDISIEAGLVSAGVDSFRAAILGQGSHGARPHEGVDPLHITAHVLLALHGVVSRRLDPTEPAVLTVGSVHGGVAENVIPERVEIAGTIRFMTTEVRDQLHVEIERALGMARALGGDFTLEIKEGGPPMVNDQAVADLIQQVALDLLGAEHLAPHRKQMGGEDFTAMLAMAPGAMFGLGAMIEGDPRLPHNPRFDIDECCLPIGVAILTEATLRCLQQRSLILLNPGDETLPGTLLDAAGL